ncbi:MAG: triose-phosphate isomerase [Actinobacteria bacterium]|nr:triose-phosphate isomerase [Actinomycetota bacterium]
MSRTPLLAANWKMHKTVGEALEFLDALLPALPAEGPEVVLCPAYTALAPVVARCVETPVRVAAQNMHQAESGAFTGEVSAAMLLDLGVEDVILGHSERRALFAESDEALAEKLPTALEAGLEPILCVGEDEAQRDADQTAEVLTRQIEADLAAVEPEHLDRIVIAYEPIWAIGTGRTATPEQAQEAVALIRERVATRDAGAAERVRILYGGSVKPANAAELLAQPDVDGALVGGASLEAADFAAIVAAAAR